MPVFLPSEKRASKTKTTRFFYDFDAVCFWTFGICWVARKIMERIVKRWSRVGDTLFLMAEKEETKEDGEVVSVVELDGDRWLGWCFFWVHFVAAVGWYECVYDEKGTRSPDWVQVFGR